MSYIATDSHLAAFDFLDAVKFVARGSVQTDRRVTTQACAPALQKRVKRVGKEEGRVRRGEGEEVEESKEVEHPIYK